MPDTERRSEYRIIRFRIFADGTPGSAAAVKGSHTAVKDPPQSADRVGPENGTAMTFEESVGRDGIGDHVQRMSPGLAFIVTVCTQQKCVFVVTAAGPGQPQSPIPCPVKTAALHKVAIFRVKRRVGHREDLRRDQSKRFIRLNFLFQFGQMDLIGIFFRPGTGRNQLFQEGCFIHQFTGKHIIFREFGKVNMTALIPFMIVHCPYRTVFILMCIGIRGTACIQQKTAFPRLAVITGNLCCHIDPWTPCVFPVIDRRIIYIADQQQIAGRQSADIKSGVRGGNRGFLPGRPGFAHIRGITFPDSVIGTGKKPQRMIFFLHDHVFIKTTFRNIRTAAIFPGFSAVRSNGDIRSFFVTQIRNDHIRTIFYKIIPQRRRECPFTVGKCDRLVHLHPVCNTDRSTPLRFCACRIFTGCHPDTAAPVKGMTVPCTPTLIPDHPQCTIRRDPEIGVKTTYRTILMTDHKPGILPGFSAVRTVCNSTIIVRAFRCSAGIPNRNQSFPAGQCCNRRDPLPFAVYREFIRIGRTSDFCGTQNRVNFSIISH